MRNQCGELESDSNNKPQPREIQYGHWSACYDDVSRCLIRDRYRLRKHLKYLSSVYRSPKVLEALLAENEPNRKEVQASKDRLLWQKFKAQVQSSQSIVKALKAGTPDIKYNPSLPIVAEKDALLDAIKRLPVVVIAGETGSGKTTQIPKFCLEVGQGIFGRIVHTQPRRIAARSVAQRLSQELDSKLGDKVGYQVRFEKEISNRNYIRLVTDGFLLSELSKDPFLNEYDTIVVDEAHERSLNIDLLLGLLKNLLSKRKDLKVIVTSATIDVQRFAEFFNGAPVFEVSGRLYPIKIEYRSLDFWSSELNDVQGLEVDDASVSVKEAILYSIREIHVLNEINRKGDVLVFLPGEREIRDVSQLLRRKGPAGMVVIPLYARLSKADQARVFSPKANEWRVILSTNVAETSLTVPNIAYVIDSGKARISRYSHRQKVQQLPVEAISQASANQRAGRCGRVMEGVCYRLYSEEDFVNREKYTLPEIYRTSLAGIILQMLSLKLGEVTRFPFLDAPEPKMINDGYMLLETLGAVTKESYIRSKKKSRVSEHRYRLTAIGRKMARIPADPKISRLLLAANELGCLTEMLIVSSALSVPDVREKPLAQRDAAIRVHSQWNDKKSDFLSDINMWHALEGCRQSLSRRAFVDFCKKHFVSYPRWLVWRETHRQLKSISIELKLSFNSEKADYRSLHQALLSAYGTQVGVKDEGRQYLSTRARKCFIHPASGLFKVTPKWWFAAEMIETEKLYANKLAVIDPEWVIPWTMDLIKTVDTQPTWNKKLGYVVAQRETLLLGLSLMRGEKINLSKVDPKTARETFIHYALVLSELGLKRAPEADFLSYNQSLIEDISYEQEKSRRSDMIAVETERSAFFDKRIPSGVNDRASFLSWWKIKVKEEPCFLNYDKDWLQTVSGAENIDDFPDVIAYQNMRLPLRYRFKVGDETDGVTLILRLPELSLVPDWLPDWVVPGLLAGKCEALIRGLPKRQRKYWMPVKPFVAQFLQAGFSADMPLKKALQAFAYRLKGDYHECFEWPREIEHQYMMRIEILDENDKLVGAGYDLAELQHSLISKHVASDFAASAESTSAGTGGIQVYQDWPGEGELPEKKGHLYSTLKAVSDGVCRTETRSLVEAKQLLYEASVKLFALRIKPQFNRFKKSIVKSLWLSCWIECFENDKTAFWLWYEQSLCKRLFLSDELEIKDVSSFNNVFEKNIERLGVEFYIMSDSLEKISQQAQAIRVHWAIAEKELNQKLVVQSIGDISNQINHLTSSRLLENAALWLERLEIYWQALDKRVERLPQNFQKDLKSTEEINELWVQYETKSKLLSGFQARDKSWLEILFWFQELRVSMYAQPMKTKFPVSAKRLSKAIENCLAALIR